MEMAVRGIGTGDVREVGHALHRVHEAKQATAAALIGDSYRLPKNGDRIERFRQLDEAFHHDLERIVVASRKNDVEQVAAAVGNALGACKGCHEEFRGGAVTR
jgi:cytochrome c556